MTRLLICMTFVALSLACSGGTTAPDGSFLQGVITSREPLLFGVADERGPRTDSVPAMFVVGGGSCDRKAHVSIGGQTEVFRRVDGKFVRADTGQLVLWRRITVWFDGPVLASCPPIAGAGRVLIEGNR